MPTAVQETIGDQLPGLECGAPSAQRLPWPQREDVVTQRLGAINTCRPKTPHVGVSSSRTVGVRLRNMERSRDALNSRYCAMSLPLHGSSARSMRCCRRRSARAAASRLPALCRGAGDGRRRSTVALPGARADRAAGRIARPARHAAGSGLRPRGAAHGRLDRSAGLHRLRALPAALPDRRHHRRAAQLHTVMRRCAPVASCACRPVRSTAS